MTITRNQSDTIHGLAEQVRQLDLGVPAAWDMLGEILAEMTAIQEGVTTCLDNHRFQQVWGDDRSEMVSGLAPRVQDDSAAADGTEVPLDPTFQKIVGFMAPQVRR